MKKMDAFIVANGIFLRPVLIFLNFVVGYAAFSQGIKIDDLPKITPIIAVFLTLYIFIEQMYIKRKDEQIATYLKRLDTQLSKLYGPLYSWYQIGDANFHAYNDEGHEISFKDPNYLVWLENVFMITNVNIDNIIINNADLFVKEMPKECIEFCRHVAALKTCIYDAKDEDKRIPAEDLDKRRAINAHPRQQLQFYILAAFEVLKKRQHELLSNSKEFINEEELYTAVQRRKSELLAIHSKQKE